MLVVHLLMDVRDVMGANLIDTALEYIAPAALLIQMCDREPGRKKEALEAIEKHIDFFIGTYCGAQAAPAASAPPESGKGSENDE